MGVYLKCDVFRGGWGGTQISQTERMQTLCQHEIIAAMNGWNKFVYIFLVSLREVTEVKREAAW